MEQVSLPKVEQAHSLLEALLGFLLVYIHSISKKECLYLWDENIGVTLVLLLSKDLDD